MVARDGARRVCSSSALQAFTYLRSSQTQRACCMPRSNRMGHPQGRASLATQATSPASLVTPAPRSIGRERAEANKPRLGKRATPSVRQSLDRPCASTLHGSGYDLAFNQHAGLQPVIQKR